MSKTMSDKTRVSVGLPPSDDDSLSEAIGVRKSKVTPVYSDIYKSDPILKAEKQMLQSKALEIEDDPFVQLDIQTLGEQNQILEPTYHPVTLTALTHQNNTMLQAVAAMEINIDGTGYELQRKDGEDLSEEDDKKTRKFKEFFDEPWPGMSFTTIRRKLRRDLESSGNAFLEVIRNQKGEITFLRYVEAKMMRLLRLDQPRPVTKKLIRGGKEITMKVVDRRRRYVQVVGNSKVRYFKEFGIDDVLDSTNGKWKGDPEAGSQGSITGSGPSDPNRAKQNEIFTSEVKPGNEATEILHFTAIPDVLTPYGVPRWINNLPSVLGSRKAEEFNLEFFDHGGLPPAMILIMGGQLSKESMTELTNYLAGKAAIKQRGVIAEIFAASGDLGSAGNVKVSVERFGDERQKDSMFQAYDERCAEHVRIAYRLPPMFLGLSEAYNFATAYTAYMIAEAQVFSPERKEFDEIINLTIMKEMDTNDEYIYRSRGLNVVDVEQKIKGLELSKDYMNPTSFIASMNEIVRTDFVPKEGIDDEELEMRVQEELASVTGAAERREAKRQQAEEGEPVVNTRGEGQGRVLKMQYDDVIKELAEDWADHLSGEVVFEADMIDNMTKAIDTLQPGVRKLFNSFVGLRLSQGGHDDEGVAKLLGCVGHNHD